MWTAILTAGQWVAGTKAGRIVAAVAAAIVAVIFARAKWRGDGAREERAQQAVETVKVMEKANEAAAEYRADGAVGRLRDGNF